MNTIVDVTFESDEGRETDRKVIYVPITDDEINEAIEQVFVIHLVLVSSPNPTMVQLVNHTVSLCWIIDDDREFDTLNWMI